MSKKSILLLIIITAIIATMAISTFYEPPGIDNIDVSTSKGSAFKENTVSDKVFDKDEDDIFLTVKTNNLSEEDIIKVRFMIGEGALYQETIIALENKGSSMITVQLLKKDDRLMPGDYHVEVFFNDRISHEISFSIH